MSCSMLFADEIVIVQSSGNNTNITLSVINFYVHKNLICGIAFCGNRLW